jgi:hypothetical protein
MIELRQRQWIIDERPRVLFSGEVHCFRLARRPGQSWCISSTWRRIR